MPKHVGIILDGNRRWARNHSFPTSYGHQVGAQVVDDVFEWCHDLNIRSVTIYVGSDKNLSQRSKKEVRQLLSLIGEKFKETLTNPRIHKYRVRVKALGNMSLLPPSLQATIASVEDATKDYDGHYVNVCVGYGGRRELTDAMKAIAIKVKKGEIDPEKIDENMVSQHLYTAHLPDPEPDLIIRTSGEVRLSGFLSWQSAYSELIFRDESWPDFRKIDFMRAIRTYQKRQRRLGK
jgi:tritrans,polycis-undecaprenyl-diphosphate synthase [geranylgeranyl-diphosphate specific]